MGSVANAVHREPWNKGKIVGQKAPFKVKDIWALRVRLQMENRVRELALFNLGIDSKLRGYDLVSLKVRDICHGDQVASRAMVMRHKTQRPVQFEITPATPDAVQKWIKQAGLKSEDFVFPSRIHDSPHLGTRQYARIPKRATESGSPGRWWRVHPKCKTPTRDAVRRLRQPLLRVAPAPKESGHVSCSGDHQRDGSGAEFERRTAGGARSGCSDDASDDIALALCGRCEGVPEMVTSTTSSSRTTAQSNASPDRCSASRRSAAPAPCSPALRSCT